MTKTIRADKLLSSLGLTSRRGAEQFLKSNRVTANGVKIQEHGQRIEIHSEIKVNGVIFRKPKKVYFLLNKPKGIISTAADEYGRKNVVSLIKTTERIFPVGRLDRDTHGLLLLTNDGELTNILIHPKYHIPKTYQVTIKNFLSPLQKEKLENGVDLEDGITQPAKVTFAQRLNGKTVFELTIYEGRKRQVRRMCDALNLQLLDLERVRFGNLAIDDLKVGEYRTLSGKEVEVLKKLTTNA